VHVRDYGLDAPHAANGAGSDTSPCNGISLTRAIRVQLPLTEKIPRVQLAAHFGVTEADVEKVEKDLAIWRKLVNIASVDQVLRGVYNAKELAGVVAKIYARDLELLHGGTSHERASIVLLLRMLGKAVCRDLPDYLTAFMHDAPVKGHYIAADPLFVMVAQIGLAWDSGAGTYAWDSRRLSTVDIAFYFPFAMQAMDIRDMDWEFAKVAVEAVLESDVEPLHRDGMIESARDRWWAWKKQKYTGPKTRDEMWAVTAGGLPGSEKLPKVFKAILHACHHGDVVLIMSMLSAADKFWNGSLLWRLERVSSIITTTSKKI
jgi:hypothetical protein